MNKIQITDRLRFEHQALVSCIGSMNQDDFNFSREGKWDAGQTLDHLYRSVSTLTKAMLLPKFIFKIMFGKANRPSREYDELVKRYKEKLAEGGKAHGRYLPQKISFSGRESTMKALKNSIENICKSLDSYTEQQLDYYILPHPLLGKLTIREMMFFTMYHAQHHRSILLNQVARTEG